MAAEEPTEATEKETETDLEAIGDHDAIFEALWKRCLEAWEEDKPHNAILDHALKSEKLPDLAGRYRDLKDDEAKGPRAAKRINAIVIAATQMMMATKTPPRTKTPWQWNASAIAFFALVISYLFYALVYHPHR